MATYPLLQAEFTDEGTFDPFELFSGEADIITDNGIVGASSIVQFSPVARDAEGLIVPWSPLAGTDSKAGTFSGVGTAADTIVVNGVTFTLTASPAVITDVLIGGTVDATAANLAKQINLDSDNTQVLAVPAGSGGVLTLYALQPGAPGTHIAISESSSEFAWAGGATALSGGSAAGEAARAIGIAAQAATTGESVPYFIGGVFNPAVMVWPASVTTLGQQKAAFDRTNIDIRMVKGVSTNITYP